MTSEQIVNGKQGVFVEQVSVADDPVTEQQLDDVKTPSVLRGKSEEGVNIGGESCFFWGVSIL